MGASESAGGRHDSFHQQLQGGYLGGRVLLFKTANNNEYNSFPLRFISSFFSYAAAAAAAVSLSVLVIARTIPGCLQHHSVPRLSLEKEEGAPTLQPHSFL